MTVVGKEVEVVATPALFKLAVVMAAVAAAVAVVVESRV